MTDKRDDVQAIADDVIGLEEEIESSGFAAVDDAALARAQAILHTWVDSVAGVVMTPALGRVTLIHKNGRRSSIASADLPFLLSLPA